MLLLDIHSTLRNHRMFSFLFLVMEIRSLFLRPLNTGVYVPCVLHIRHRLAHSSMLWWRYPIFSCRHTHCSSTGLAVCQFNVPVANAWTSMVLITTSSRIHVCPVSVCGLLFVRNALSISVDAISSKCRLVVGNLWHVRHRVQER